MPFDLDAYQGGGVFDEVANVAGQQAAIRLLFQVVSQAGEMASDVAAIAEEHLLFGGQRHDLFLGQPALQFVRHGLGAFQDRLLHILLERYALEKPADGVEDLFGAEAVADRLQFVQQRLNDQPLAGLRGHQIDDLHGIMLLAVAVNPAHPLLEASGIPRHVEVDHDPAELEIDAFGRSVGADHEPCAAVLVSSAKPLDLSLAILVIHAAVNLGDLARIAHPPEATDKVVKGVSVLGEDDQLLTDELGVGEHLAELVELRLGSHCIDLAGQIPELHDQFALDHQVSQGSGDNAGQEPLFGHLAFFPAVHGALLVGRLGVQHVVILGHAALKDEDLFLGELAHLHLPDQVGQLLDTALE